MQMCDDTVLTQCKQKNAPWVEVTETKDAEETAEAEEEAEAHLGHDIVRATDRERTAQMINRK